MREQVNQLAGILANVKATPEQETEIRHILDDLDKYAEEYKRLLDIEHEHTEIAEIVSQRRHEWGMTVNYGEGEITCLMDDVASLLTDVDKQLKVAEEGAAPFQNSVREIARKIGEKHDVKWNYDWPLLANVQSVIDALDVRKTEAEDNAAAIRAVLEKVVETATNPERTDPYEQGRTLTYLTYLSQRGLEEATGAALRKDIRELEKMCEQFEEASSRSSGFYYNRRDYTLPKRVRALVDHYNRTAADAISKTKAIQDEMVTWLQGLRIVAEMVGNGGTHAEKNARLRGLTEVIESALNKMQQKRVQAGYDWYSWDDVFKGDYPVREYIQSIHRLEDEIKQLKKSSNGHQQPEAQEDSF